MTRADLDMLYADVRRLYAEVIPDFDFAVEDLYRQGDVGYAIAYGLSGAAAMNLPIPADVLDRARPLLEEGERERFAASGRPAA